MDTNVKPLPVDLNNLKHQHPESHKIHAYEFAEGTLFVQFKSNANRLTYAYPNHPVDDVAKLDAAESKGKHFNMAWVKQFTVFEKLPGTTQEVTWPSKEEDGQGQAAA